MPQTVYAATIPIQFINISQCESNMTQFNADGTVVEHHNTNGTYDIGLYEINSSWLLTAKKMGIDIYTAQGNIEFALWLSNKDPNYSDWDASKACWDKDV